MIVAEYRAYCDEPGCHTKGEPYYGEQHGSHPGLRAKMVDDGWIKRGHKDICPECARKIASR